MASSCVSNNSKTNMCELDGITVTATSDDDDDEDDEDEILDGSGGRNRGCGDERDTLIAEYMDVGVVMTCERFTRSLPAELNHPEDNDHAFGILDNRLVPMLNNVRAAYDHAITLSSGYRCPVGEVRRLGKKAFLAMVVACWAPLAAGLSSQETLPQAAQVALAHDLRGTSAKQVMRAVNRLYDVPVDEWDGSLRKALADAVLDEMMRPDDQKVLDDVHQFVAMSDLALDIAFEGDTVVIPALILFPEGGPVITAALYELGEPAFRALLDMVSSASPVHFADQRTQDVTRMMYSQSLDVLAAFVHYDGVDTFDRETQAELRAMALRTLESATMWFPLNAGMRLALALGDPEALAAVEALTDRNTFRARGITDPWEIDRIERDAKDAMAGRMRVPCCGLPTPYRRPSTRPAGRLCAQLGRRGSGRGSPPPVSGRCTPRPWRRAAVRAGPRGPLAPLVADMSSSLWDFAEVALRETRSAAYLADILEGEGSAVERGVAGMPTAFVASWASGEGGPTLGVLAGYDALPQIGNAAVPRLQAPARRRPSRASRGREGGRSRPPGVPPSHGAARRQSL